MRIILHRIARRMCCPFGRFFRNPHHLSGVVFAMLLTNVVTLVWSGIVLSVADAMKHANSRIVFVTEYVSEDWLAATLGSLALAQLVCLWTHLEPTRFRNIGYGVMSMAWGFVFFHNVTQAGPIYPIATSASFGIAFTAFYAWLDGHTAEDSP